MKRIFLVILVVGCSYNVFSQSELHEQHILTNKNGIVILPVWGDFGLGLGAYPLFSYFGNFFKGTDQNHLLFHEPALTLKYYSSSSKAYRVRVGISINNVTERKFIRDDFAFNQDPLSLLQSVDRFSYSDNGVFCELGIEFRKGKTRLQGFYGGGPYVSYSKEQWQHKYGNPISDLNSLPSSFDFGQNLLGYGRVIRHNAGSTWRFGLNTFLGVEYFFLPKASLGTQVNLSFFYAIQGKEIREVELWESGSIVTEMISYGNLLFNVSTLHSSFNTFLIFHF